MKLFLLLVTDLTAQSYVIPILLLGKSLGSSLIPLNIANHDFHNLLNSAGDDAGGKQFLERWYKLDDKVKAPRFRFNADKDVATEGDMKQLYKMFVDLLSIDLRDTYLTTVVEQEINNTIFKDSRLARKSVWIHTGALPSKSGDEDGGESPFAAEENRRLTRLQSELKVRFNKFYDHEMYFNFILNIFSVIEPTC